MLKRNVVTRLLKNIMQFNSKLIPTAIYATRSADVDGLGTFIGRYIDDECYLSRGVYAFDYTNDDIFIETEDGEPLEKFNKIVNSGKYQIVFMLVGSEGAQVLDAVDSLDDDNDMIFITVDNILSSYQMLSVFNGRRQLKRRTV